MAYRWLAPFPTSALLASLQKSNDLPLMSFYLKTAVPVAVLVILFLIIKAVLEFRRIRVLEEHASLEANKPPVAR